ncbi:MAG: rRNA pseudouridine synthase [Puniceicoccales bacterium]|jgi:23S rRNA pseudouridine2605 synthase|nr:rRNA pseudouridine synthase [Puniceicoccales bacterium]
MRIQKFLSQCGYCARRKAEVLIAESRVTINSQPAKIGQIIDETSDIVKVDQVRIRNMPNETIVLLLNKPRGIECTAPNKYNVGKTVFDFIPRPFIRERFLYCGRLDKESQGMLILTNNGDFANRLTHPSTNITKVYSVTLSKPITKDHIAKMLQGFEDEGEFLKAEKILECHQSNGHQILEIHLKQGRKHEIRRMIEKCNSHVHRLKRIQIGQLKLKNLNVGDIKLLAQEDINRLFI